MTTSELRLTGIEPPKTGEVVELAPALLWIRLPVPMALKHVNIYVLEDDDGWTLIDTGFNTPKMVEVWEGLLSGPLSGKPVRRVWLTHHHPDHVGLVGWFQERDAALSATRTAWLLARMLTLDEQELAPQETLEFWRGAGMPAHLLEQRASERPFNFADVVHPMPLGFTRIADCDVVEGGGRRWRVRTGGGHAAEHATFWEEDGPLVLGGDQFLPSISPNLGVYATEPEADPVADWLASCAKFQPLATTEQFILPGHGLPYHGLPKRLEQLIENHHSALDRLRAKLKEPHAAVETFRALFKRDIADGEFGLAMVEAMAHCLHLWHRGEVSRRRRDDGAWLWQMKDDDG